MVQKGDSEMSQLEQEIETIYKHVKELVLDDAIYPKLSEELNWSVQMLARSGEILAHAEIEEKKARAIHLQEEIKKDGKIGATMLKEIVSALTANESKIVTLSDRLNRLLVHRIDALRTQISYVKSDLERSRYQ